MMAFYGYFIKSKFSPKIYFENFLSIFFREFYDALVRADSGIMDAKTITDLIMHLWPST